MKTVTDIFNRISDQRVTLSGEQRSDLREIKIQLGKVESTMAELRIRQVETFKFARERGDAAALPPTKLDS